MQNAQNHRVVDVATLLEAQTHALSRVSVDTLHGAHPHLVSCGGPPRMEMLQDPCVGVPGHAHNRAFSYASVENRR